MEVTSGESLAISFVGAIQVRRPSRMAAGANGGGAPAAIRLLAPKRKGTGPLKTKQKQRSCPPSFRTSKQRNCPMTAKPWFKWKNAPQHPNGTTHLADSPKERQPDKDDAAPFIAPDQLEQGVPAELLDEELKLIARRRSAPVAVPSRPHSACRLSLHGIRRRLYRHLVLFADP
jgi:hypothetical protein